MSIRIVADRREINKVSDAITKAMEELGYSLIGATEKTSRDNPSDRLKYLNFIHQSAEKILNDEL